MNLEFLSGLLLVSALLATLGYIVKEVCSDFRPGKLSNSLRGAFTGPRKHEAKPVNEHLIGAIGKVVANSDDDDRPMKVRLGLELWPARTDSARESRFPVGTCIEVTTVREPLVIVRQKDAPQSQNGNER